jgi:lysozyme
MRKRKRIFLVVSVFFSIVGISAAIWFIQNFSWTPPPPPIVKKAAPDIIRHPQSMPAWGIDISHHQSNIHWSHFTESHIPHFVFLKATEGTHFVDNKFYRYASELKNRNIPYSGYHFMRFNQNGKEQAEFFLKIAKPQKGQLIPVVDIEAHNFMATQEVAQANIDLFMETIRSNIGVYPIVYCDEKHYVRYIKDKYLNKVILWIANYSREPKIPYDIWQKSCRYKHPSFNKRIDYNLLNHNRISMIDLTL